MSDIIAIVSFSALGLYAVVVGTNVALHGYGAGQRQWALFIRWCIYGALLLAAISAWVLAGIGAMLFGSAFWQGTYVGGSVTLWLGYVPALVWVIRSGRREVAKAKAADAGVVG